MDNQLTVYTLPVHTVCVCVCVCVCLGTHISGEALLAQATLCLTLDIQGSEFRMPCLRAISAKHHDVAKIIKTKVHREGHRNSHTNNLRVGSQCGLRNSLQTACIAGEELAKFAHS